MRKKKKKSDDEKKKDNKKRDFPILGKFSMFKKFPLIKRSNTYNVYRTNDMNTNFLINYDDKNGEHEKGDKADDTSSSYNNNNINNMQNSSRMIEQLKTENEENKRNILNRFKDKLQLIDKNNKLVYMPFYLTESFLNLIPHYNLNKSFMNSFCFFQNYFFENNQYKIIKRENSIIYNNIITINDKKDFFYGNNINGNNKTEVNISFCIYQLIILCNIMEIFEKFEGYLNNLIIKWCYTDLIIILIRDMLSLNCNKKIYFLYKIFEDGNISFKNLKKLLLYLDITYDDKILKILYSVLYDQTDNLYNKMKKIIKMYDIKNHKNTKFINYITSTIIYLNNLFQYFNKSNHIFTWDFFMNHFQNTFGFAFAFNIYSNKNTKYLLSFGGVSTQVFTNYDKVPQNGTYNIIFEIFVDSISNIIFQV